MPKDKISPDFTVQNEGSIVLLHPITAAANEWCDEFLPEDASRFGHAYAIEHRYIDDILHGIIEAGLEVGFVKR